MLDEYYKNMAFFDLTKELFVKNWQNIFVTTIAGVAVLFVAWLIKQVSSFFSKKKVNLQEVKTKLERLERLGL